MFYKTRPININDLTQPIKSFGDRVYDGNHEFESMRNIFELEDLYCYKNQIISESHNGEFINIIGTKPEKRNFISYFSFLEKFKLSKAKKINNEKNNFIFIPLNRKKTNYWHCLVDNISQLLFILQNINNVNVLLPKDTGEVIKKYVSFLAKNYNFTIMEFDYSSPIYLNCKVVLTEPSLFGGFEHNKKIANQLIDLAKKELKIKKIDKKNIIYKFGSIHHRFLIEDKNRNEKYFYKCYPSLRATPIRKSAVQALKKFGFSVTKNQNSPKKIIYSKRDGENSKDRLDRNPINETELIRTISEKFNVEVINFAKLEFNEQIDIMQNTKLFICIHGSGSTNTLFMHKNTHFIEIMPYRYSVPVTDMSKIITYFTEVNYTRIDGTENDLKNTYNVPINKIVKVINDNEG